MVNASYAEFPPRILGHKCAHYRKDHIIQILMYYNRRHAISATKKRLPTYLLTAEKTIPKGDKAAVQAWMNQWPEPCQRFSEFINRDDGTYDADDSEDDMPLANRKKSTPGSASTTITANTTECAVWMESLGLDSFPKHKTTPLCNHSPITCSSCLRQSIESEISDRPWDQIQCPDCPELLPFDSVKAIVSPEAFERYDSLPRDLIPTIINMMTDMIITQSRLLSNICPISLCA
jgi:hypothetical protein